MTPPPLPHAPARLDGAATKTDGRPKKGANGFCAPAGNNSLEQCAKHLAWEVRALPQSVPCH